MKSFAHPSRVVALAFLALIAIGTVLLMLPASQAPGVQTPWLTALFTAVSAVCVTGLAVVDTGTHWSGFGQAVILVLFQFGGFGIMTAATLLGLMVNQSLRLRTQLLTQAETHTVALGDVRSVAKVVFGVTVFCELGLTAVLAVRLHTGHAMPWPEALWSGFFHAVSAFNNAGFGLHSDSLVRYASDAWILVPIMVAIAVGGLGFPVMQDIRARWSDPRHWSLHSKLTLVGTAALLLLGWVSMLVFEWSNPKTFGPMPLDDKLLSAAFASVSARTAGFNAIDIGALTNESWGLHYFQVIFEVVSAFGTVGMSTGITASLPPVGQLTLIVLMYLGRVGTITLATSLALGERRMPYRYAEEHPIVG